MSKQQISDSLKYCMQLCWLVRVPAQAISVVTSFGILLGLANLTSIGYANDDQAERVTANLQSIEQRIDEKIIAASSHSVFEQARELTRKACLLFQQHGLDDKPLQLPQPWRPKFTANDNSEQQPLVEDIERRGRTVGQRYSWRSAIIDRVNLSFYGTSDRRFVELILGVEYPVLRMTTRSCDAFVAQRVEYRTIEVTNGQSGSARKLSALQLVELNTDGEVTGDVLLLNPDWPETSPQQSEALLNNTVTATRNSPDVPTVRVALIDSGVNYLLPEINASLLRDESGQPVGYDYWDDDDRPFDMNPRGSLFNIQRHGTRTASLLVSEAPGVRIAPFRFPRPHMHRMQELVAHIAALDIKLIGMALGGNREGEWQVFEQAAKAHPEMLFVVSAGNNGRNIDQQPVYPAALLLENMIVVSSADDTTRPAEGSNWGREHVDYLLPAEYIDTLDFDGNLTRVSGSSYAVSRMLALLVRLQQQNPDWQIDDIKSELRRRFHDGARAQYIGGGYIGDPLSVAAPEPLIVETSQRSYTNPLLQTGESASEDGDAKAPAAILNYELVVLDSRWDEHRMKAIHSALADVLAQCNIHVNEWRERRVTTAPHLATMSVGGARTLRQQLNPLKPTLYLATSTRTLYEQAGQAYRFDAEAFGHANTRGRDWLRDTVWISENVQDVGLAAAHELVHVLMNDGSHTDETNNLMNTVTAQHNRLLNPLQCKAIHENGARHGLLKPGQ